MKRVGIVTKIHNSLEALNAVDNAIEGETRKRNSKTGSVSVSPSDRACEYCMWHYLAVMSLSYWWRYRTHVISDAVLDARLSWVSRGKL